MPILKPRVPNANRQRGSPILPVLANKRGGRKTSYLSFNRRITKRPITIDAKIIDAVIINISPAILRSTGNLERDETIRHGVVTYITSSLTDFKSIFLYLLNANPTPITIKTGSTILRISVYMLFPPVLKSLKF